MTTPAEPRLDPPFRQLAASVCTAVLAALCALAAATPARAGEVDSATDSPSSCRVESTPRRPPRPLVVIDDPDKPLDVKDPYYAEKLAARYRRWVAQVM